MTGGITVGSVRAKYVLRELLEREVGAVREVGWVKTIGHGRSRDIFAAEVDLVDGRCDAYVVALPRRDADRSLDERTRRELRLVATLPRTRSFPFRLPQMVGAFPDGERLALVRRYAAGVELDLRAGGDPAYDLAIVTRGVKQPFQIAGGLDRLLAAYRAHRGLEVSADQVHLHKLCVIAVGTAPA